MIKKDKIKGLLLASTAIALLGSASVAMATTPPNYTTTTTPTPKFSSGPWTVGGTPSTATPQEGSDITCGTPAVTAFSFDVDAKVHDFDLSASSPAISLDGSNRVVTILGNIKGTGPATLTLNGANQTFTFQGPAAIDNINGITFALAGSQVVFNGPISYDKAFTGTNAGTIVVQKDLDYSGSNASGDFSNITLNVAGGKFTHVPSVAAILSNVTIADGAEYDLTTTGVTIQKGTSITGGGTLTLHTPATISIALQPADATHPVGTIGTTDSPLGTLKLVSAASTITMNPKVYVNDIITSASGNQVVDFVDTVDTDTLDLSANTGGTNQYTFEEDSAARSINFSALDETVVVKADKVLNVNKVTSTDNKHGIIRLEDNAELAGDIFTNGTLGINKIDANITAGKTLEFNGGQHTQINFITDNSLAPEGTLSLGQDTVVSGALPGVTTIRPAITTTSPGTGTIILNGNAKVIGAIGITAGVAAPFKAIQIAPNADIFLQPTPAVVADEIIFQDDAKVTIDTGKSAGVSWITSSAKQRTNLNGKNVTITIQGDQAIDFTNADTVKEQFNTTNNATANANIAVNLPQVQTATATLGRLGRNGGNSSVFNSLNVVKGIAKIKGDSNVKTITLGEQGSVEISSFMDSTLYGQPLSLNVVATKAGTGGIIFSDPTSTAGSGATGVVIGSTSKIGSDTNRLGSLRLNNGSPIQVNLDKGANIYVNAITAAQTGHIIAFKKGNYDLGNVAITLPNSNATDTALSKLQFAADTKTVSIGSARIDTIILQNAATLELKGNSYSAGIYNTNIADTATVKFSNSKDLVNFAGSLGQDTTGTNKGPINTVVIAGNDVKFATGASLYATKIRFEADSVLSTPTAFDPSATLTTTGNLILAKTNIGTIEVFQNLSFANTQDSTSYLKEWRISGASGSNTVTIGNAINTYSRFTTATDGTASASISGTGTVAGDIGSSSKAFSAITIASSANRTFNGSVFAKSFTVNSSTIASFQGPASSEITLNAPITLSAQDSILTMGNNSSINGTITTAGDGFGTLNFGGASKNAITDIGTKTLRIGTISLAKNGSTATSRSIAGDIYAKNFNVTDAELKLGKNINIAADNVTLSNATISADKYVASLTSANMKLSGVLKLNTDLSNSKVLVLDATKIDYSGLTAISADTLGLETILPENGQIFNLVSFATGTKPDAATQEAIYKLVNVSSAKTSRYVQYTSIGKGNITAKVDFSQLPADLVSGNAITNSAVEEQVLALGNLATALGKDGKNPLLPAINNAEVTAQDGVIGASLPIVAALAPSTTGNVVAASAVDTALGAVDSLTGSLDASNSAVVASGDYDDIRVSIVGQGVYGKASADTTETYRGHSATSKAVLLGVQASAGNISGGITGVYSPTDLTYNTKLNYGTAINGKGVAISDTVDTDTVTALSTGYIANVAYGLQGGVYANATIGRITTSIDDNTIRLNSLTDGQKVTSSSNVISLIGRVTTGYTIDITEDITLAPLFGLNVLNQKEAGYTEQGTGPAKLEVKDSSSTTVSGLVGAKLNGSIAFEDDIKVSGGLHGNLVIPISSGKHTKATALAGSSAVEIPVAYAADSIRGNVGGQVTVSKDVFSTTLGVDMYRSKNNSAWTGFIRVGIDM